MPLAGRRSRRGVPLADPLAPSYFPGCRRAEGRPQRETASQRGPRAISVSNMRHNPVTARLWWFIRTRRPRHARSPGLPRLPGRVRGGTGGAMVSSGAPLPPSEQAALDWPRRGERFLWDEPASSRPRFRQDHPWPRGGGRGSGRSRPTALSCPISGRPNLDTSLTRSAMPVLRNLYEHLDGQPISIILTDSAGVVLSRMTADRDLERELDAVPARSRGTAAPRSRSAPTGSGPPWRGASPRTCSGLEPLRENLERLRLRRRADQ